MIFNGRISNAGIYVKPPAKVIKTRVIISINGTRTLFTFSIPLMPFFTVKAQKTRVAIDMNGIFEKKELKLEKTCPTDSRNVENSKKLGRGQRKRYV